MDRVDVKIVGMVTILGFCMVDGVITDGGTGVADVGLIRTLLLLVCTMVLMVCFSLHLWWPCYPTEVGAGYLGVNRVLSSSFIMSGFLAMSYSRASARILQCFLGVPE